MFEMNMSESERLILGLRSAGWDAEKINNFLLYIANGDEKYMPRKDQPVQQENAQM